MSFHSHAVVRRGPVPDKTLRHAREYTVSVKMRARALNSQRYIARCFEFPDLVAYAGSEYRAVHTMRERIRATLLRLLEDGKAVPTPCPEDDYTGT